MHLELPMQIIQQSVHILAEGVVLLHADEVGDERIGHGSMLALPGCPVGELCAHCCNGMEPGLQQLWVETAGNSPASRSKASDAPAVTGVLQSHI